MGFGALGYGEIKGNIQSTGVAPVGVDLHTPDVVALAQSYGWQAQRVTYGTPATQLARLLLDGWRGRNGLCWWSWWFSGVGLVSNKSYIVTP